LEANPSADIPRLGSNDEIEELSVALSYFVRQSQRADQAKNDFIAVASHQLRTPLAAMKWTLELLTQEAKEGMQKEILSRGTSAVKNMENIAEGLLLSVRVMNGLSDNHLKEVSFNSLLDQAIKLVTPLAEKKNIDLTTSVSENLPAIIMDEEHMLWANQNLLDNAIKYTLAGGKVSLSAIQEGSLIKVSVADSGIGISTEDQTHMFEKFFRAQNAVETSPDGSGLGLSIVKSIIEAHGGEINFVSKLGEGTTFTYTLPINATINKYDKIKV
jgi:signal transduction histidine kinase